MKTLRRPHFSVFFSFLILFISCSQENLNLIDDEPSFLDALELEKVHAEIKLELKNASEILNTQSANFKIIEIEQEYIENSEFLNENSLQELFVKHKINDNFIAGLEFYIDNQFKDNSYELLAENFKIKNVDEARFLFNFIEVYKMIELSQGKRIGWGCALAIAGTIATTAGAAFITGGAALIVFLVAKGLATASIINACR